MSKDDSPSNRDIFNATLHPSTSSSVPPSNLPTETPSDRIIRLRRLYEAIAPLPIEHVASLRPPTDDEVSRWNEREKYKHELWLECEKKEEEIEKKNESTWWKRKGKQREKELSWDEFVRFCEKKEVELWYIFDDVDRNRDGALDREEIKKAFNRAGMEIHDRHVQEFLEAIDSNQDGLISFPEWRDFLLLLPRHPSIHEIYSYYQAHRKPVTILTPDGDFILGETEQNSHARHGHDHLVEKIQDQEEEEEEQEDDMFKGAGKFLLAGGIAGAVSRTATAPFDRLKVYLITSTTHAPPIHLEGANPLRATAAVATASTQGLFILRDAITSIYKQGGIRSFFVGNGLNVIKIFPESAVKFLSYESSKRVFARYWDRVDDVREISGTSRFISGGIGGIISQLMIYPIETLKTRVMSSTGGEWKGNRLIVQTSKEMWKKGGMKTYFKGLIPGLIGVFPYSAIDMSVFESLKNFYITRTGNEPGVFGVLAIGSFSGGIGATSVYPLNLVRTRMQAQGTPAHPQVYTGFNDVASKTWQNEGIRGFYRGLTPTLGKVVPSVALSWLVYEQSKKLLFEQHEL